MTHRFTLQSLAALVISVAIVATGCNSDDGSPDDPLVFPEDATAIAPTATTRPALESTNADPAVPPVSDPEVSASAAPANYGEVGPDYVAAHSSLLAAGREIADALLSGDAATPYALFSEELKAGLSELELEAILQDLHADRVHFAFHVEDQDGEANANFDGRLSDDVISGSFALFNQDPGTFSLERSLPADPAVPLVGQWVGAVVIGGAPTGLAVTIDGEGESLRGTIDIPEGGLSDVPLRELRYEPAVRSGELLAEGVLPWSPDRYLYISEHAWGPSTMLLAVGFDQNGTVVELEQTWQAALPQDPAPDSLTETEFRLPFDGVWWVLAGGPKQFMNHHVVAPSQRHGYDTVIWRDGATHGGDGARNEDYWAWGEPALAPADGTIVAVLDGLEDNTPGLTNPEPHAAGNHVVLRTGAAEFLLIGHLQQGSIRVKEGDQVTAGAVVGLTGNSGNSFEPHIHIHLQNEQDFFSRTAIGLPLPFTNYVVNGEPISAGHPIQGQFVQQAEQ